jgi:hypothetical protein
MDPYEIILDMIDANAVQGETIGNLNIPAVLEYKIKRLPN